MRGSLIYARLSRAIGRPRLPLLIEARLEELGVKKLEKAAPIPLGFTVSPYSPSKPCSLVEGDELIGRIVELYEFGEELPLRRGEFLVGRVKPT